MVGKGIITPFAEILCQLFGLFPAQAVDDPGIILVLPDIAGQGDPGIFLRYDRVPEIVAVETANEFTGTGETQLTADIFSHLGDRSCSQRDKGNIAEMLLQNGQLAVFRPEIMAPFRYTVRFIDGNEPDRQHRQGNQGNGAACIFPGR